jgi:hypothetical protein
MTKLTEELRKLADLHKERQLTDQEFADAKRRLITGEATTSPVLPGENGWVAVDASSFDEKIYKSSLWSSGNMFFPDSLKLAADGMLFHKGALFSSDEEHINYRSVASFRVKHGIFFSDLRIETSGGSQPIFVNGLWKADAKEIEKTIRAFQATRPPDNR